MINNFKGEFAFLSNFYSAPVEYKGDMYPTVEHAFQAAKSKQKSVRKTIREAFTAGQAKKLGKDVDLRSDWEDVKKKVMWDLLLQKFQIPALRSRLLATGSEKLVEGNYWHDNYWGICSCKKCESQGKNMLGKLLMRVRKRLEELDGEEADSGSEE